MENKIVFVAASGSMKENALKIVRQMGLSIPAIISKPGSVLEDVARYPDAEVFISRWSTAQALRSIGKNVVEIRIEFQDLITPLQDLTKAGLKTVAVVTPKGLIANSDKTYEISDTTVLIRSYELIKDADKVVQSLIRDKVEGFIGSQAVIDSAEKWEVPAQFLNCREDSIRHAVEEAQVRVENLLSERRRQSDFLQQIQKFSTELYDSIDQAFRDMKKLDQSSLELASVSKGGADIATKAFEQMENTDGILKMITKITSQTTLLGINGAIESARVGEQGRGFSVIVDEIRQLAIKSKQSADIIGEDLKQLKCYVEDILKNSESCKSISENQAMENRKVTEMLKNLSQVGQELIQFMNTR